MFLLLLFQVVFLSRTAHAEESTDGFSFSHTDHQLHMLCTYGFSTTFSSFLISRKVPRWKAVLISSATTMALAYSKERWVDPHFDNSDMIANSVGVTTSALIVFSFGF